jgi:hypothetical protein
MVEIISYRNMLLHRLLYSSFNSNCNGIQIAGSCLHMDMINHHRNHLPVWGVPVQ